MTQANVAPSIESLLQLSPAEPDSWVLGSNPKVNRIARHVERAADVGCTVLISGETGTGKEVWARLLHQLGPRRDKPFVPVHTSAIPSELLESTLFGHVKGAFTGAVGSRKGLFEAAHEGTLFLDEVGSVSLDTQTKLLRVIQEREFRRVGGVEPITVDVRLVAATNANLWELVNAGRFREDLYYRLNVISIELPRLTERKEDVPLLAAHFLRVYAAENDRQVSGFSPRAMDLLTDYSWPGNVRELQNAVERAVVLCRGSVIEAEELPPSVRGSQLAPRAAAELPPEGLDFRRAVAEFQMELIRAALQKSGGVQRKAARLLGLSPTTFNEMVHRLGLQGEVVATGETA